MSGGAVEPFILIVEDYLDLADSLSRLLRRMGYVTEMLTSGEEALKLLEQRCPTLIILDLMMPGVSGLDVLRQVRASLQTSALPVIVYTTSTDQDLLKQCIKEGANEVWLKGTLDFFQIVSRISVYMPPPKTA